MILNKLHNIHARGRNYAVCMVTCSSNLGVNKLTRLPKFNIFRKHVCETARVIRRNTLCFFCHKL